MRRLVFAALGLIATALPGCAAVAVAPPPSPPPPVALVPPPPPPWQPAPVCRDPVTRTVQVVYRARVYRHRWFHHRRVVTRHIVTRVRLERRIVACNRYHPPPVVVPME
jgi:hypothetical protein